MLMRNKAVFLDRDGTINVEKNYLYRVEDFAFIKGSIDAIKLLNEHCYKVIVITNQAGIARGYYQPADVLKLHCWVNEQLAANGAHIDAFYFCPHHPAGKINEYAVECDCRKPGTALIEQAIREFAIDITRSYFIGDKNSDVLAGKNAGLKTILVLTGYGQTEDKEHAHYIAENLHSAVRTVIL